MSALPQYAPFEISKAVSAHSIALGFIKNTDGDFEFVGSFAAEVEKYFELNLVDELTFFSPTGKRPRLETHGRVGVPEAMRLDPVANATPDRNAAFNAFAAPFRPERETHDLRVGELGQWGGRHGLNPLAIAL